jgi:hypothetical protein
LKGKICTSLLSERCLIGAAKRGRSDAPRAVEERQMGEGEGGKASPICGAKGNRKMDEIEEVGNIDGNHRNVNKDQRWRRRSDIYERG